MDDSFIQILKLFKENIMTSVNVAEVAIVKQVNDDKILCTSINDEEVSFECEKLNDLELAKNDIVLILFTNKDFRQNLRRIKNNKGIVTQKNTVLHSASYGIIIGKIGGQQ